MDTAEITNRILKGIDEDPAAPSEGVAEEVRTYIQEGQSLFAWLTLCLETTTTWSLSGAFGSLRPTFPDFLVPLKVEIDGVRVRPATLAELDSINTAWQSTAATPTRYCMLGFQFYSISPQAAVTATITYARSPQESPGEVFLEIPDEYHPALVCYGIYRARLKEGAQGLERGMKYFNDFLDDCTRMGDFVRARSQASRYDTLPIELKLFDRSRLMLKPPKPQRGNKPM